MNLIDEAGAAADLKKLQALEGVIMLSFIEKYIAFNTIKEERLYSHFYDSFEDYLRGRFDITNGAVYFRKLRTTALLALQVQREGINLANMEAARAFRSEFSAWINRGWLDELIVVFCRLAQSVVGEAVPVTASTIRALSDATVEILQTGGAVYLEDDSPDFQEFVEGAIKESKSRQIAAIEKSQARWQVMEYTVGTPLQIEGYQPGDTVEIKLRIIDRDD